MIRVGGHLLVTSNGKQNSYLIMSTDLRKYTLAGVETQENELVHTPTNGFKGTPLGCTADVQDQTTTPCLWWRNIDALRHPSGMCAYDVLISTGLKRLPVKLMLDHS